MTRPRRNSWAEISLEAIRSNFDAVRRKVGPGVGVLPVVKADAYGHGAVPVSRVLVDAGAERLAVALPQEGVELREAGITVPVLILGHFLPSEAEAIVEDGLTPTVANLEVARALSQAAERRRNPRFGKGLFPVHIKVDTGMGRLGVWHEEALPLMKEISQLPALEIEGAFTHFPAAEACDKSFALEQIRRFEALAEAMADSGIAPRFLHAANSAAVLDLPGSYFSIVRPGVILYGAYPSDEVSRSVPVQPSLALRTHIVFLKDVPPGQTISYGCTWTSLRHTRIATLPIGYCDGYPRSLSGRAQVLVRGQRCPIVGRVCMDQCLADVGDVPEVSLGDEVVLMGEQSGNRILVEEVAQWAESIPHEILSRMGERLPRVYR